LTPGGSSTVHIYTQTVHRTTQITTNLEEWGIVPRLCDLHPGICLTTEEKGRKSLSQGSRRVLVYILPKHPHITKPTHTHTPTHCKTHTYEHTYTLQNNIKQPQ
jgi:hypothetical protein